MPPARRQKLASTAVDISECPRRSQRNSADKRAEEAGAVHAVATGYAAINMFFFH